MDLACSLGQSSVVRSGEGTSCKIFEQFESRNLLRNKYFSCKVRGNSRTSLRTCTSKKVKRNVCFSGCENVGLVAREKYDGHLWSLNARTSLFCSFRNSCKGQRAIWSRCQSNDSLAYVNGNGPNAEFLESNDESGVGPNHGSESSGSSEEGVGQGEETEEPTLDELRELLQKAMTELEVARLNSTMFEEKAQRVSEAAIALQDEAANAWTNVNSALDSVQQIVNEESVAKEAVQKATMALSLAEARLQVAIESLEGAKAGTTSSESSELSDSESDVKEDDKALVVAQEEIKECQLNLSSCEAELRQLQSKRRSYRKK